MSTCDRLEELRDYALDEMAGPARPAMEQHIGSCGECAMELDRLRATASALRMLPDREIPQRIAFVSDKVFEPSRAARWFGGIWNSAARLGFASACLLAVALLVSAWHLNNTVAKGIAQVRQDDRTQLVNMQEEMMILEKRVNNQTMVSMLEPRRFQ